MAIPRSLRWIALLAALVVGACAGAGSPSPTAGPSGTCPAAPAASGTPTGWDTAAQKPTRFPSVITAPSYCGKTRFLFSFLSADNRPIGSPDLKAQIAFYDLGRNPAKPTIAVTGTFIWAIEGQRGIYTADVDF